jgi:hypothetical protein
MDGAPDILFATINCQLAELACQSQAIAEKYNDMITLVNTARELADKWKIAWKVCSVVDNHLSTFSKTVATADRTLNQWYKRLSQLLSDALALVNPETLDQQLLLVVDSAVTATLATPAFTQQLASAIAMNVTTQVDC